MEKEVLECILKNRWNENTIQKILSIESSPAVEKFRNLLSTVKRLKLRVVLGNGRQATRHLFTKEAQVPEKIAQDLMEQCDPFKSEIMMYETILKEMEYLMAEFEDADEVLWGNMVHCVPNKTIVLEDLQARGFNIVDKSYFFDLDHGLMTVHALGKFHALSKVLEERGILSKDSFKPWYFFKNDQIVRFGFPAFTASMEGIKLHWGPRWKNLVDKIDLSPEKVLSKLKELGEVKLNFNVLCHGDCNKNNIMFKYDWDKRPTAIKFVDYQMAFYGSPACDLNQIMYLNVHPVVRRNNFNLFMKTYHESLCNTLDSYKFTGSKPSLEEIIEAMETYCFLGYWMFINFYQAATLVNEPDKYMDIQKIVSTGGQEGYDLDLYKIESLVDGIGPDLETFVNKFF